MDYKFVTINVALCGFLGIIFLAIRHKRSVDAEERQQDLKKSVLGVNNLTYIQSLATGTTAVDLKVENVMVVSRIHRGEATAMVDINKVIKFIEGTLSYSSITFVCVSIRV
jgi:plasmid stability protein